MQNKKGVGAYHKYLCRKIEEKRTNCLDNNSKKLIISRHDFKKMLGWFNIPSYIQNKIIDEMKDMELIKIKDKQNIVLVKKKKDDSWFD